MEKLEDCRGFARTHPGLALCMAVFMLSLAGLPPFGGFFAKFLVFRGAIDQGYVLPAVVGILTSVASLGYYLRVIQAMYLVPEAEATAQTAPCRAGYAVSLLTFTSALGVLLLGLVPNWVVDRMPERLDSPETRDAVVKPVTDEQIVLATRGEHEGRRLP